MPTEVWQYNKRMTLATDIFVVNSVLYFNLSSANNKHVLEIKKTSVKFQKCNYLSQLSLPKSQECIQIRSLCCLNQMEIVGIDFNRMIHEAMSLVDHGATESV